jgi:ADP-ribose pyrophosphatase
MNNSIRSTQPVFKGRLLQLDIQDVALPDGSHFNFEVVTHPGGAGVVALDHDGNILLVRQFRAGVGGPLWELPAGLLDPGESPDVCAVRELQEETGYKPGRLEYLGGFFAAPGYCTEYLHLFVALDLVESRLPGDDDEVIEVGRIPFGEALAMIETGDIVEAKTIIGLLRVAARPDLLYG